MKPKNEQATGILIDAAIGTDIEHQYQSAMRTLLCACLRNPHQFHQYAGRFSPVWWEETPYANLALAMFEQFNNGHRFSAASVLMGSGKEHNTDVLRRAMDSESDISLDFAFEHVEPTYQRWAEYRSAKAAIAAAADGAAADEIREAQDIRRRELDAFGHDQSGEEVSQFDAWVKNKLDGIQEVFACRPPVLVLEDSGLLRGFAPGDLIVVAGRPSMGKTHFALNCANKFASDNLRGLFFSVEMTTDKLMRRLVGIRTGINPQSEWAILPDDKKRELFEHAGQIKNSPCKIISGVTHINHLVSTAMAEHYLEPIRYILVDYLQLLQRTQTKNGNREQEISEMTYNIKQVGMSLKVPVILLAQLSRAVEQRADKRPQLSDLRESGAIEQTADIVIFPHRPEYYGMEADEYGSLEGVAELIIRKNRNGKTGTVRCRFDGVTGFTDETPNPMPKSSQFTRTENVPF
ncbi:MAG TPA: DnaB-like helicase C-terminal domain-containing protein [bacterium]|nr:DnaB-like helicase C-terminal domain-containing protein [bacterium]HNH34053.1 DnaB-like helicase C-terminal domain-containing protein [bacterium]